MKICKRCEQPKDEGEYYRISKVFDSTCKTCRKAIYRENWHKNYEHNMEVKRRYNKTEAARKSRADCNKRMNEKYREKYLAREKLHWAMKTGKIVKPKTCEDCGAGGVIHGHHDDYAKPLEVKWLCMICHKRIHGVLVSI